MIPQEDFQFITQFDVPDREKREQLLQRDRLQCAHTFLHLLGHISKDQTLQYILVLADDMLQVCMEKFNIIHLLINSLHLLTFSFSIFHTQIVCEYQIHQAFSSKIEFVLAPTYKVFIMSETKVKDPNPLLSNQFWQYCMLSMIMFQFCIKLSTE